MCGIVGLTGRRDPVAFTGRGLRRLEYRGDDSAGVAVLDGARNEVRKACWAPRNLVTVA